MAPEHIEFYQIHEKQSLKVLLKPAQRRGHPLAIGFCMVPLRQSTTGKKVFNFADANHFFPGRLEEIQQGCSQGSQGEIAAMLCALERSRGADKGAGNYAPNSMLAR